MFNKDITGSDAFLDMPASTQALYFHLGMEADDDGFIGNPKKVMRVLGVNDDDLKILLSKKFLLIFESGVVVVKHHRMNNNWDKYNCKRTVYLEEFSKLNIKDNKAYTLDKLHGIPVQSENSLKTVFRIEENRIDKNTSVATAPRVISVSLEEEESTRPKRKKKVTTEIQSVFDLFEDNPARFQWKLYESEREAAAILHREFGIETLRERYKVAKKYRNETLCPKIHTPSQFLEKMPKMEDFLQNHE